MFGQQKAFKWLLVLAIFCFSICGKSLAEEEMLAYEEGMRLISVPRNATAADSVMQITEAYITCDHSMLTVGEETRWTLHLEGAEPDAYTFDYRLWHRMPTDSADTHYFYSGVSGTTSLAYTDVPEDAGTYFLQVLIYDQYGGVLDVHSTFYTTGDDALTQKVAEVVSLCKKSGAKTGVEIALFMHDYLIDNADYDHSYTDYFPEGVLLRGQGTCQSYATAYKLLLEEAGMECLFVVGTSRGENHAWNMVKIDGKWYQVDCTWDDPTGGNKQHSYFLITDQQMAKDHEWNEAAYPACDDARYMGGTAVGDVTYAGFTFNGGFGDITIKSYNGTEKNVVVPATINGRRVKRLTQNCFLQNDTMETLVISEGVEHLDSLFVALCYKLKSISIPSTAALNAFNSGAGAWSGIDGLVQDCEAMETIIVADGNPYLRVVDNVLYNKSLTDLIYSPAKSKHTVVRVPDGVQVIRGDAFANNAYLKEVILPDSIRSIGYWAFNQCTALEKINIPENCVGIGQFAFQNTKIAEVHIPAATTTIVQNAFSTSLRNITVDPANPVFYAVDGVLFTYDGNLQCYPAQKPDKKYTIPENVNRIGMYAFLNARNLAEVEFPQKLQQIEHSAFSGCSGLRSVELPASITVLEDEVFFGCTSLAKLVIPPSVNMLDIGRFFLGNVKGAVIWGEVGSTAHVWAEQHGYAFHDMNQQLELSGTCGDNVTWTLTEDGMLNIHGTGEMATSDPAPWAAQSNMIKKVIVEEGVLSIGDWAFNECRSLTEVYLPESLTRIGERAFAACASLEGIDIPGRVTSIGNFAFYSCTALNRIDLPEAVTRIGGHAFAGCHSLKHIDLPDNIIEIDSYTFEDCRSLSDIQLPSNLLSINQGAFRNCSALTTINLPDGFNSIAGDHPFEGCTALTSIKIPDSMALISSDIFRGCTSLTFLRLSESLFVVHDNAFANSALSTIVVPSQTDMVIYGNPFEGIDATVYCYWGSSFHTWATSNGIKVKPIEILDFSLPKDCALQVGTTIRLAATPPYGDTSYLDWYISDHSVATVQKNQLTAVGAGTVTIRLSYEGELIDEMVVTVVDGNDGHEWDDGTIAVKPGCTTTGLLVSNCISCDLKKVEIIEGGHNFGDEIITLHPTCNTTGQKVFICNSCGYSDTEDIPATDHTVVGLDAVAPTCTTPGRTEGKWCIACGTILLAQTDVPALGHGYNNGVETTVPTCTEAGVKTFTCATCGASYTEAIPAKGHAEEVLAATAPTCTATGLTEGKKCGVCGETLVKQEVVPAQGHAEGDGIVTQEPTALIPGVLSIPCANCGTILRVESIPTTGEPRLPGDADGDGEITIFDALVIFEYVAEERDEINLANADVDGNGIVNIHDALRILQYVSGWNVALL